MTGGAAAPLQAFRPKHSAEAARAGGSTITLTIAVAAALTIGLLLVGGLTTHVGAWYAALRKPSWNPPNWLFGPAWTVILGLAGWAGVEAWTRAHDPASRWLIGGLFGVNMVLHALWSPLFFTLKRPDWALIEAPLLWLSVLALMVGLSRFSSLSAWLIAPYLVWVAFAVVLNVAIVRLNAPFGRKTAGAA